MSLDRPKIFTFSHQFLIQPVRAFYDSNSYFINAVQQIVDQIIPESIWIERESGADPETTLYKLNSLLPLFRHSETSDSSESLTITYLCPFDYTHQARRYVIDTLRNWLYPGKQIEIQGGISLHFYFVQAPAYRYFIAQDILSIRNQEERIAVRKNLPDLLGQLKKKLPCEFLGQTESNIHPIFMPRNEEETIRNLIVLSNQIKYVRDLPQVSIHYEKQTDINLTFTIIIARLLKGNIDPLRKLLEKSSLKMDIDDVRIMGYLKQKHVKEAAVLRISIEKRPFFRADYSVDLLRARQKIVAGIAECLGEFRDFNGGMILKQEEALNQLRQELGKLSQEKEFLLENYFYSIKPGVMQTVHESLVLKEHFELLNAILESNFDLQPYQIIMKTTGKFLVCFIAATSGCYKEKVLNAIAPLKISSRNLTMCFLEVKDKSTMGFILRMETSESAHLFQETVEKAFHDWSHLFYCIVK